MKYSIKIGLHVKPNNKGGKVAEEVAIRLRVSWSSRRVDIRSGYTIAPSKWDSVNCCVRSGAKNNYKETAGEINRALLNLSATVEEVLTTFEVKNKREPSVAEFNEAFNEATGRGKHRVKPKELGFFDVYDRFVSETGIINNWTKATYTKLNTIKSHLLAFRPNISLTDFSKTDYADFTAFLTYKVRLLNPTTAKYVEILRWFLKWAFINGYYSGAAHEQYRPRFKGLDCKEVIFLEWDELQHFLTFDFSRRPALGAVRDVFCFCAFTSLRYSDVAKLLYSDIHREATPPYMTVVTKKTTDRLRIELNKYALSILDKYAGVELPKGLALPVISNVKMNAHLHEAAEITGLDSPVRLVQYIGHECIETVVPKHAVLTTHAGRRTFIVNALRLGIPAPVIMEWTGHSDYKAMKPYIKIVDVAKVENMEKFNNFGDEETPTAPT